jgi:putative ABC transport system permease protein
MTFPSKRPDWRRYLLFWRRDVQADVDAELRFHFDSRIEELVAQGLTRDAAHAQAAEEFGDVHQVAAGLRDIDDRIERRRGRLERIRSIWQDAHYAARSLARTPALAVTIVATLALGLGANAALFSLIDVLYLRLPAGVRDAADVRRVWHQANYVDRGRVFTHIFDYPTYRAMRDALGRDATAAIYTWPSKQPLTPDPNGPTAVLSFAGASYFEVLGARPRLGRVFNADEDRFGSPALVAVVSDDYWRRALDAREDVLGTSIAVGKRRFTIIGVMAAGFTGADVSATDIWMPLAARSSNPNARWWEGQTNGMGVLFRPIGQPRLPELEARLTVALRRPDLSARQDTLNVARFGSIIEARGPGEDAQEMRIAARLAGVSVLVLLIACANVVNLLLARAMRRRREIAVRIALGISRSRLVRLLLVESTLLALAAAVAAIAAAYWGGSLLRTLLLPDVHWVGSPVHWRVLALALLAAIAAGIITGLVPAVQSLGSDVADALKSGGREGSPHRSRLRGGLVATQAALSLVLLVGAALFLRSLHNVRQLDIGFDAERLIFGNVSFATPDSIRDRRLNTSLSELAGRLRSAPGVERVALTHIEPMHGISWLGKLYPDADTVAHKANLLPTFSAVSSDFFAATGLRFLRGHTFADGTAAGQSVIINDELANELWPGENPLGRCIRFVKPDAPCYSIVGVVETARQSRIIEPPKGHYYVPLDNVPLPGWTAAAVVVRADPRVRVAVVAEIRRAITKEFPGAFPDVRSMTTRLEPQYRPWKLGAELFSLFGVLALVVAAVGIYSTVSYTVSQRTPEFGVRIALGARLVDVLRLVLADSMTTVTVGVVVGIVLALTTGRLVATLLYGISPTDPTTMILVALTLLVVAAVAAMGPAWRAARVNPVSALRAE